MAKKVLNVAMIGAGFMGKAHSNAWTKVTKFFDVDYEINLKVLVGSKTPMEEFAQKWGYDEVSYNWREVVAREDIDIVDIGTPTFMHRDMVIAAVKAGKHVVCEKPFTLTYGDAQQMLQAAREAGVLHYLNHNYRRVPAVALAKQLIDQGRLGRIYHWRGSYLQDWIMDPNFPVTWHLKKECAGGGPLYDLSSHSIDLARYLVGEPVAVTAVNKTFIQERPAAGVGAATFSAGTGVDKTNMIPIEVDDASVAIIEFENGAIGTVETSRFATGRKNYNTFEIYGSKGALCFNLERMNELQAPSLLQLATPEYRSITHRSAVANISSPSRKISSLLTAVSAASRSTPAETNFLISETHRLLSAAARSPCPIPSDNAASSRPSGSKQTT